MSDPDGGLVWLQDSGEITLLTAQAWKERLLDCWRDGRPAVLDLSQATEVDLPALQLVLSAQRTCAERGRSLTVRDPKGLLAAEGRRAGIAAFGGDRP